MKTSNKKRVIKIIVVVFILIVLVVIVPLIINESYKQGTGYVTLWNASDVLSYYGAILASVGGIFGVFFTVKYSQKQYRKDARLRIMPFIATDFMLNNNCCKDFVEIQSQDSVKNKNEYDHFIITYSKAEGIKYPLYLSEEKCNLLQHHGVFTFTDQKTGAIISSYKVVCFIPCMLKNVGAAVALKMTFGLYKLKNGEYLEKIDDRTTSKPFVLDKGEKIYVGLFFDLDDEEALGTYKFDIMYSDIEYTRYRRSITFEFTQNPNTKIIEYNRIDPADHMIFSEKEKN